MGALIRKETRGDMEAAFAEKELQRTIVEAVKLHGHLGPFLVVGVRMGGAAKRIFNQDARGSFGFHVMAKVPLVIPFSCTIDGIQVATHCTLGNQRLRIENTRKQISASFRTENLDQVAHISVNPRVIRELLKKMSEGIGNDDLAEEIATMPETRLFRIEKE
jgi:formylmethanofuran dehydrogenase subunit E